MQPKQGWKRWRCHRFMRVTRSCQQIRIKTVTSTPFPMGRGCLFAVAPSKDGIGNNGEERQQCRGAMNDGIENCKHRFAAGKWKTHRKALTFTQFRSLGTSEVDADRRTNLSWHSGFSLKGSNLIHLS